VAKRRGGRFKGVTTSRWAGENGDGVEQSWARCRGGQGGDTLLPCSREPSWFEQRRCEPLADGEVHAQSPMKWALDVFGEPCEAVNLRQRKSGKCGSTFGAIKKVTIFF